MGDDAAGDQKTRAFATVGGVVGAIGGLALLGVWGAAGGFILGAFVGVTIGKRISRTK